VTDLFKPTYIRVGIPHNTVRPPTLIRPPTEGGEASRTDLVSTTFDPEGDKPSSNPLEADLPSYVGGDLVVVMVTTDTGSAVPNTPAGWTLGAEYVADPARGAAFWKIMDGSEGSTLDITMDATPQTAVTIAFTSRGLDWASYNPDFSAFVLSDDPPQVSMSHGVSDYDVYVFAGIVSASGVAEVTVDPAGYTELVQRQTGSGDSTGYLAHQRIVAAETEDPGALTIGTGAGVTVTFAILAMGTPEVAAGDHSHVEADITDLAHTAKAAQPLAFSKTGTLEVTTGASKFPALFDMTLIGVRAAVGTAPTGADLIVDVNKNGTTVYTTQGNRPTISDGATSSSETVPDVTAVAAGDLLSVDIDQVGSSTEGSDLVVAIEFQEA
jgi:hypothetical protein